MGKVATFAWAIWISRNNFVFNHHEPNAICTLPWAQKQWSDVRSTEIARHVDPLVVSSPRLDHPPGSIHDLCLRCDGAFKKGAAAIGLILQGPNVRIMDGFAKKIPAVLAFSLKLLQSEKLAYWLQQL
ncbi:unnamed protein product, partial [Ilex paraguariensis]